MDSTLFYENIKTLSDFFGKNLTEKQADFYFSELKYASIDSFKHAVKSCLKERKPNPGNFPTITELQSLCPKDKLYNINYNSNETEEQYYQRITVNDLWEAYNVLKTNGQDRFLKFCESRKINGDDIERVEWKLKYTITPEKLEKKIKTVFSPERVEMLKEQANKLKNEVPF